MTIKDIAQLAGCGVGTVSRVLNGSPGVSDAMREKVLAVVRAQGFQPNSNARHLKQLSGRRVAVIVRGTQNMLFAKMAEQIQALMQERGVEAAVYYLDEDDNETAFALRLCREYKPPAILFLGGDLEYFRMEFAPITVPCVLLTNTARDLGYDNLSSITTDDGQAAERAVDHLILHGHRSIGILGGNRKTSQMSCRRVEGALRSFARHGVPFSESQCETCRYSMEDAYAATGRLLDRHPKLTAIFALSDVMALGAIRALRDRGLRVPEDVSIMGFDGIPLADFSVPRLCTVRQDTHKLVERGVDILLERLERPLGPAHETVPFEISGGESVAEYPQTNN